MSETLSSHISKREPLRFYVALVRRDGLRQIREEFLNLQSDGPDHCTTYEAKSDSLKTTERNRHTDTWETYYRSFEEHLSEHLESGFQEAEARIDRLFMEVESEEAGRMGSYLLNRVTQLKNDLSDVQKDSVREAIKNELNELAKEITSRRNAAAGKVSSDVVRAEDGRVAHKQNKHWIVNKWKEIRRENQGYTQKSLLDDLEDAYRERFKRKPPSRSTLRRYAGKK